MLKWWQFIDMPDHRVLPSLAAPCRPWPCLALPAAPRRALPRRTLPCLPGRANPGHAAPCLQ